jgi:flavin reductase (DIM6/NTAB) family NADH-FMN oxidoreductase RutF
MADPESLRRAMRHWVAGVTVVTTSFGGLRHGMTVSSFTSISLIPPMILVSLERGARTYGLILQAGYFGVSILRLEQQLISEIFAGRVGDEENRFEGLETFNLVSPAPLIMGALAYFDCRVVNTFEAGTSTVFLAEVVAAASAESGEPLVYTNRTYHRLHR